MAIEANEIQTLGTSKDSIFQKDSSVSSKSHLKILVISENSSEIFMVKKLLSKVDGYIVHEAATLSAALKVINYLSLDLIIVDDKLSIVDGYEVVEKLNHIEMTRDIPKLILLTTDYKIEKRENFSSENIDFVKKPLDDMLFKLRVKSLIHHAQKDVQRGGYFRQLSQKRFEEAESYMHIYQEIFEKDENIMAIYDAKIGKFVESNAVFEKFFLPINAFNRIMHNPKLARKFVPFIDEVNYLNYYDPRDWMDTIISGSEFNYLIKLHRDFKEYSFNIFVKKIQFIEGDIYLFRLSNIYDYLPQKSDSKVDMKMQLKEKNLHDFKDDFLQLREALWYQNIDDMKVEKLLYTLSTKLSIICEDASIVQEKSQQKEINVYFTIVRLLKEKFLNRNIYLNGRKVDLSLEENHEQLYLVLNADSINDLLFGLLNNYYGNYFNTSMQHKRLDIELYRESHMLMIDIILDREDVDESATSFIDKIFHKNIEITDSAVTDALPKNVKQSLLALNAHIKKVEKGDKSIFTINIPLD